jgi:hypothetical protein
MGLAHGFASRHGFREVLLPLCVVAVDRLPWGRDENDAVVAVPRDGIAKRFRNSRADEAAVADEIGQAPVEEDRTVLAFHLRESVERIAEHQRAVGEAVAVMRCRASGRLLLADDPSSRLLDRRIAEGGKRLDQRCFSGTWTAGDDEETWSVDHAGDSGARAAARAKGCRGRGANGDWGDFGKGRCYRRNPAQTEAPDFLSGVPCGVAVGCAFRTRPR